MKRVIAISLKIPDNAAYTTLTTLQRLGIAVARVERSDVHVIDDHGDPETFIARVESDETIFNPNKHRLTDLGIAQPRPGEVWIGERGSSNGRYVGWRLLDANGAPADHTMLERAATSLLCNPAIETAIYEGTL